MRAKIGNVFIFEKATVLPERLLTFVHISDTHIHADPDYTGRHVDFSSRLSVQKLIDTINQLEMPIDFVLHTGDITQHPDTAEHYHIARDILSQINYPVYYIPGNHDDVAMLQKEFLGLPDEQIKAYYDYQFDVNGVQIVMMDSHAPVDKPDNHNGFLADEQLTWLDEICSADDTRPLVIGIHHHALPLETPWLDGIVLENGADFHQIVQKAKTRLRGIFYGHIHESVVTIRDGISYYSVPSGWFQTRTWYAAGEPARDYIDNPGFNLVTLTETDTFVRSRRIQG